MIATALLLLAALSAPLEPTFSNACASITFTDDGRWDTLVDTARSKNLLTQRSSLCVIRRNDDWVLPQRLLRTGKRELTLTYPEGIRVRLGVVAHGEAFYFKVLEVAGGACQALHFDTIGVSCNTYVGTMVNMVSDDHFGVALRACDVVDGMGCSASGPSVTIQNARVGAKVLLVAAPRKRLSAALAAAGKLSGAPMNEYGGPYALTSEAVRGSYLFTDLRACAVDDVIDLAQRSGIETVHIHAWWQSLGHYSVRSNAFPRGMIDFSNCVARIHAAGLRAGIHTLTGCVAFNDPAFKSPQNIADFNSRYTYKLAEPLGANDAVVRVVGPLKQGHDRVMTYSGNGNVIRIGAELIEYKDFNSSEDVSTFSDLQRGWKGTRAAAHGKGEDVDYVLQRYDAFYPTPETQLGYEIADSISNVFRTAGLDQIYFDGSEGMGTSYAIDWMRNTIFRRLGANAITEASCWGPHNWWFHSRLGAWDTPSYATKYFVDLHVQSNRKFAKAELQASQLGWWCPKRANSTSPGHYLDDMEYFAGKASGYDYSLSVQGAEVVNTPLCYASLAQMTILGWYERLRLARAFTRESRKRLIKLGTESRLRRDEKGAWTLAPVVTTVRRVATVNAPMAWKATGTGEAGTLGLRVEALYASDASDNGIELIAGGKTPLQNEWPYPYKSVGANRLAFIVRMKGENSGSVVRFTIKTPREYTGAVSDHYILDDFTGWRDVVVLARERDAGGTSFQPSEHTTMTYPVYRNTLKPSHLSEASVSVVGGARSIEIASVRAVNCVSTTLKHPTVSVAGVPQTVPFDLTSGSYAELENGFWTHYDEQGTPIARAAGSPLAATGEDVAIACKMDARAEVTLFAIGQPQPALKEGVETPDTYYALPAIWNPKTGQTEMPMLTPFVEGPAQVGVVIHGPVDQPKLTLGRTQVMFSAHLEKGDRLICRDGRTWRTVDKRFQVKKTGTLNRAMPELRTAVRPVFTAPDNDGEPVRVEFCTYRKKGK